MLLPISGGAESPKERLDRLVAEGMILQEAVDQAERLWRERLQNGVLMPNGEIARLILDDIYHIIVDSRIGSHPERIVLLLEGVADIREAALGRRRALSVWQEDEQEFFGYAILEKDSRVRTLHVVRPGEFRRMSRQGGRLWP